MRELRCSGNRVFGLLDEDAVKATGVLEVKCGSLFCGKRSGVVVLHRFDLSTGEYNTRRYSEPNNKTERGAHGTAEFGTAVRPA